VLPTFRRGPTAGIHDEVGAAVCVTLAVDALLVAASALWVDTGKISEIISITQRNMDWAEIEYGIARQCTKCHG
jgi:hypothetical protein